MPPEIFTTFLPGENIKKLYTEPDCYGASRLISNQLKLPFTPRSFAYWLHGWNSAPVAFIEQFGMPYCGQYLVHTTSESNFLVSKGFNATAVGSPFLYTTAAIKKRPVKRLSDSLLIMPPHGMLYTTEVWNEKRYIEYIAAIKDQFEYVAVCISPSDIEKGIWVSNFSKLEIPIIKGAAMHDANALIRMRTLFELFEFVTTNSIGSHVAYAAYSGAKVSFWGDYVYHTTDSLKDDVVFASNKAFLEYWVYHCSEKSVRDRFDFLFCTHPRMAVTEIDHAASWLGANNIVSALMIAKLLGWFPTGQLSGFMGKALNKLNNLMSAITKKD